MGMTIMDEHTAILELEQEIIKLKAEHEDIRRSRDYWIDSYNRECERTEAAKKVSGLAVMETLIRNILDEADYQEDDENMRELRKILWNDSDTEKQIAAEGCEKF